MARFTIKLPENDDMAMTGRFIQLGRLPDHTQAVGVLSTETQFVHGELIRKGQPVKLTPLAVILDEQNVLVYNPRRPTAPLDEKYLRWLKEHPVWPGEVGQLTPVETADP